MNSSCDDDLERSVERDRRPADPSFLSTPPQVPKESR
jgi:hypothetical protein